MSAMLPPPRVREAFLAACRDELRALKPGNVHIHAPGHGMQVWHFERSAEASAPYVADPALAVGRRIRRAMEASFAIAGCNTNLGILLLAAPLARAADHPGLSGNGLRERLAAVLGALDLDDAAEAFAAIRLANPAGLGRVDVEDVARPPSMTLAKAMQLAAGRDRISRAYATVYEDVFVLGLGELRRARRIAATPELAVTTLHMTLLAAFPDSHVARKHGPETAAAMQREAVALKDAWHPAATPLSVPRLLALDADLKHRGLNPGTTADLVVATLFADKLIAAAAPDCG